MENQGLDRYRTVKLFSYNKGESYSENSGIHLILALILRETIFR